MVSTATYSVGSVSLAANGTAVTGDATMWVAAGIRAGDLFAAGGLSVTIASVNSSTSLTLAEPWPGPQISAAGYEIRFTGDPARVLTYARDAISRMEELEGDLYTSVNFYPTTAAGIASTAVGQQFQVAAGGEIIRYEHVSGGSVIELARLPDSAAFGELLGDVNQLASKADVALLAERDAGTGIAVVQSLAGDNVIRIDALGNVMLPGMDDIPVQRALRAIDDRARAAAEPARHNAAPYLATLTDAQGASYGWIDQLGEMYLPGLGDISLQRRLKRLQEGLDNDAGGGSSGSQGSTEGIMVDVVADLGCDRNFGEEVATRINAATAVVAARQGRATFYFPAGDYRVIQSIVPRNGITFLGAGWNRAVIRPVASQGAFHRVAVGDPVEYANFLGLHIDGSEQTLLNGNQYNVMCKGISLVGNRYCHFIGNYIHDTGATSLAPDFAFNAWVLHNRIERSGRLGTVGIMGSSGIGIGVGLWQEEPCLIAGNQIKGARNYGIFLERQNNHSQYTACRGYIIDGNDCSDNNYGIGDCGCGELMITNNRCHDNTEAGITVNRGTINVEPGERTYISGNQLLRNRDGIRYGPASDSSNFDEGFTSSGNLIETNSRDGIRIDSSAYAGAVDAFASMGDTIRRNGGHGVNLIAGSTVTNLDVMSGRLIENTGAAIQLDGNVTGGSIASNRIRDMRATKAQTGAIAGAGALTDVDISENQYVGPGPAVSLTGTQTRVTYGRNQGF